MCYHKSLDVKKDKLEVRYGAKFVNEDLYKEYYHASGFSNLLWPAITNENPNTFTYLSWGLIPFWVKDNATAKKLATQCLNAIGEEVFEKPSFRDSIVKRRCLIPVTGFYEWRHIGKEKYPYYISLKSSEVFSFAGVWSIWTDKETGEEKRTYSVLTTAANPLMEKIHNSKMRMPLILSKEDEKLWLEELKKDDVKQLIKPYPADDMQAHTISKLITSRTQASNQVDVKAPFEYPELHLLD
jgi:putative SOS response-associated peptidase YedK